jgi:hypothetical protein
MQKWRRRHQLAKKRENQWRQRGEIIENNHQSSAAKSSVMARAVISGKWRNNVSCGGIGGESKISAAKWRKWHGESESQ